MSQLKTLGVHHIGLTVRNLEKTLEFFTEVLRFGKIGSKPEYPAAYLTDGKALITLWQAQNREEMVEFDRKKNIGLHHIAFRLENVEVLNQLYENLKQAEGVEIEFPPEPLNNRSTLHMMCTEPGGIRIEFIVPGK